MADRFLGELQLYREAHHPSQCEDMKALKALGDTERKLSGAGIFKPTALGHTGSNATTTTADDTRKPAQGAGAS